MPFTGKVGDTLFIRNTGGGHRYVILTDPNDDGSVVITNFTTASHFDWFAVFQPKDNKRLFKERCTPNYHDARLYPLDALFKITESSHEDYVFCAKHLVKKIIIGALQSRHTPLEVLKELASQYPNEAKKYYKNALNLPQNT